LRAAGVDVWFDQSALRGGDACTRCENERDAAFERLERAYEQRDAGCVWTMVDPLLRSLHDDSRWKPFLRKMKFAD